MGPTITVPLQIMLGLIVAQLGVLALFVIWKYGGERDGTS